MSEKKFEKLDMDILMGDIDSSIIPTVESFEQIGAKPEPIKPAKTEDTEEPEEIVEYESFDDLESRNKPLVGDDEDDDPTPNPTVVTSTNNNDEPSEAVGLAKFFQAKGFLEYDEEKDKDIDEEWVENQVVDTLTKRAEEMLDENIRYINDLYKKGVPLETLLVSHVEKEKLEDITEDNLKEDEKLSETIVRKYYAEVLESDEDEIEDTIENFKDAGILTKQSIKLKDKLVKFRDKQVSDAAKNAELEENRRRQDERERLTVLKKVVDSTPEFIEGLPMVKQEKDKLFEGITKKDRQGLTQYQKALMDPDMQLKVAQFVLLYNAELKNLEGKLKTKIVQNIKKNANTYTKDLPKDPKKIASEALSYLKRIKK